MEGERLEVKVVENEESPPTPILGQGQLDFIDKLEPDESEVKAEEEGKAEEEEEDELKVKETSEPAEKEPSVAGDESADEIRNLRQLAREQKRELERVTKALEETNKYLKEANIITPEDEEKAKEAQLAQVKRQEYLDDLLEVMRVNPKYEDVDEVVSQEHFDDLVEAMAKAYVTTEGGTVEEAEKLIVAEIQGMRNPYKYMYDIIKKYHPAYRVAPNSGNGEDKGASDKDEANKKAGKRTDLSVEKVAGSIQEINGGSSGTGGWTAAKIDDLDELELDKVPPDIYEKYLRNELK